MAWHVMACGGTSFEIYCFMIGVSSYHRSLERALYWVKLAIGRWKFLIHLEVACQS